LLACAIVALCCPSTTSAQASFDVVGTVSNGTSGARVPSDLKLQIIAFKDGVVAQSWDGSISDDGTYRVSSVDRVDGASYVVGAVHQDVVYLDFVDTTGNAPEARGNLTIYEAAQTDPGLQFDQSAIMVSQVDSAAHSLEILEVHSVVNPTDRTFAPSTEGPGGAAGLLVFGLPPNSYDLSPSSGLDPDRMVEIGLGFASLNPITPGRTEIAFRYWVPYTESPFTFQRTARYPVTTFRFLSPIGGPPIASDLLTPGSSADIGGRQFTTLTGGPFTSGTAIRVSVSELPLPPTPLGGVPPVAAGAVGGAVGVAIMVLVWRLRTRPSSRLATVSPVENEDLVDQIVQLDLARERGRISETEYARKREELMTAVVASGSPAEGGHSAP